MENMVEKYLNENKLLLKKHLLDSLELYDFEKEYAPETLSNWEVVSKGYSYSENENGVTRHYKRGAKIYPQITDEEYEELLIIAKEKDRIKEKEIIDHQRAYPEKKKPLKLRVLPNSISAESSATQILSALAWITWIGGIIASFFLASNTVTRYGVEFSWAAFVFWAAIYLLAGFLIKCMAEVVSDIHVIASSIASLRVEEDSKDKP